MFHRSFRVSEEHGLKSCEFKFSSDQVWCDTNHKITFSDESRHLHAIYNEDNDGDIFGGEVPEHTSLIAEWAQLSAQEASTEIYEYQPEPFEAHHIDLRSPTLSSDHQAQSGVDQSFNIDPLQVSPSPLSNPSNQTIERIDQKGNTGFDLAPGHELPLWPFENATEAKLIRYYMQHVARRFDICDPQRHFQLVVPCRAAVCPPLMNAAFALSARQLSQITDLDEYIADKYYQKCLNSLVPLFDDPKALMDENLFAATVILRTLEEIEGNVNSLTLSYAYPPLLVLYPYHSPSPGKSLNSSN